MPLLDHFHPPLSQRRHWESFHAAWATTIVDRLNAGILPPGYFAEEQIHPRKRMDLDVAAWAPPAAEMVMPAAFPESFEVQVFAGEGGINLVAALELVSPANKDRATHRRAFATKCASYLAQGIGLILVDIVTQRRNNLHNEIVRLMETDPAYLLPSEVTLYSTAYRPGRQGDVEQIEVWSRPLALGQALPVMPLAIRGMGCIPIDLESTYADVCRRRLG